MTGLQKELGYDGFLKELDFLEILLLDFINNLPPEADAYLWRHSTKLVERIIELKTSSFLNSTNCVKRQKFDKLLYYISHFQRKIEWREKLDYDSTPLDKKRRGTEILEQVRAWEKTVLQINNIYICPF